jgi:hypothetical protein
LALVEEALVARLIAVSGVSSLVLDSGSSPATYRIYPRKLPQNPTMGAITYQLITGESFESLTGSSGLTFRRFQFDAWSSGYILAKQLAEQIRLALQGFTGTVSGVKITGILKESDNGDFFDHETNLWRVSADYNVHHEEEQP